MGLYTRGDRYYFKKQYEGKVYYRALRLRKGQERLLSERLQQVEEEIIAQHFGLSYKKQDQISFSEYSAKYVKLKKRHKNTWYKDELNLKVIERSFGDVLLSSIQKRHIEKLEEDLFARKKDMKPSTVNRYFELLRHFLQLAKEDGYLDNNMAKLYVPYAEDGRRRDLAREDLKSILEAARYIQDHPKSRLQRIIYDLIIFSLSTGLRAGNVLKLKKSYIQNDVAFFPVTSTKSKKRVRHQKNKVQIVCLNSTAKEIIGRHQRKGEDYIFNIPRRNSNALRKTVYTIREMAGVSDFVFHQLRHTVSEYITKEESLPVAKSLLWHADLKTTLKYYTHPKVEEMKKAVAKLDTFISDLQG